MAGCIGIEPIESSFGGLTAPRAHPIEGQLWESPRMADETGFEPATAP